MTTEVFRNALEALREDACSMGHSSVTVNAGAVHRIVGGYPGKSHRMPACCSVMRQLMKPRDDVLSEPSKGNGASFTIRYYL